MDAMAYIQPLAQDCSVVQGPPKLRLTGLGGLLHSRSYLLEPVR
jgi:hypothetical protein